MQGGNGDAAAFGDFADGQFASHFAVSYNRHGGLLTSTNVEVL
jgi:hypothetical protein